MDVPPSAYAAIGTISAAMIAGGISFIVSVLAKDQKTSEFRQAWIDGLRDDIAELISLFFVITDMVREMIREGKEKRDITSVLFEKDESFRKLEMVTARIRLRINPSEHTALLSAISSLKKYLGSAQILDPKAAEAAVDELVKESQLILKREWKRVKGGEPVFVATKWVSLLILVIALFLGIAYARSHLHTEFLS
jgi:hypothetical protein